MAFVTAKTTTGNDVNGQAEAGDLADLFLGQNESALGPFSGIIRMNP